MKIYKAKLNLSIDIIMFLLMMAIAGIGFLIKFVLVPGFKRNEIYGKDVDLYYWGINRHQWGTVHLILSFALLFLLFLHIIFHWKQILCIFKSIVSARIWRIILTSLFVILSFVFGIMPLFVNPKVLVGVSNHGNSINTENTFHIEEGRLKKQNISQSELILTDTMESLKSHSHQEHTNYSTVEIFGYMTINEVANKYNIPANELASCIHVPQGNNDEKLGRLRKHYGFNLSDLKVYIETKVKQQ